jgi:hypothetical protein
MWLVVVAPLCSWQNLHLKLLPLFEVYMSEEFLSSPLWTATATTINELAIVTMD